MEKMHIQSVEGLSEVVEKFLYIANKKDTKHATVLALDGDLGAGKTTFVQALAKKLGVKEIVTSPTFVIMKGYLLEGGEEGGKKAEPFSHLYHIDAYRIEDVDEMRVLRFEELLQKKDTIICIEWAERIKSILPVDTFHLQFEIAGEERYLTLAEPDIH